MQRKTYVSGRVPGVAVLLAALVTGCSTGGADDGAPGDTKPNGEAQSAAAPGRYRNLFEPCGAVSSATLKDLLPGAAELPQAQQERVLRGTAALTYDNDRRVGCSWQAESPDATHQLSVDIERVVSYDASVSDDTRAQEVFARKQASSSLGTASAPPATGGKQPLGSPGPSAPAGSPSGTPSPSSSAPSGTPSGSASEGADQEDLRPRALEGLGDAAFLDDVAGKAGSAAQGRTVSVVFRTSNVIVTVRYAEQPGRSAEAPDSRELQDKARGLARKLAERFNE
ncbi:DUF3558 domain-containing protein [Streptomyces sp. NPDC001941]|uniref:DUF3558 domain-containing protein n=1 Tax=Streptomyces sp. NPDC001941 TaxID=3154659 RepID=UPI0033191724